VIPYSNSLSPGERVRVRGFPRFIEQIRFSLVQEGVKGIKLNKVTDTGFALRLLP